MLPDKNIPCPLIVSNDKIDGFLFETLYHLTTLIDFLILLENISCIFYEMY